MKRFFILTVCRHKLNNPAFVENSDIPDSNQNLANNKEAHGQQHGIWKKRPRKSVGFPKRSKQHSRNDLRNDHPQKDSHRHREYEQEKSLSKKEQSYGFLLHSQGCLNCKLRLFFSQHETIDIVDMDTYSEMYQVDMHKQQESALMSFVLFNIGNEIVTRENAGVAYQEGSNRVCIIFTGCRSREFGDKIHSICQEIQQKVKEVIGIETSIGIGSWVRSPQELVYSYKLAEKAIGYRYLLGGSLLLDMEEKKTDNSINLIKSLETLTEEIKVGNRQKVTEILEQIEHEIKGALVEKSYACIYLQQVIRAIGNTCQSLSDDPEKIIAQREKLLKEVSQAKTFDKAVTLVKKYAEGVFESLQDLNSSSGQRQGMMAMDYIRKNYMDPDLSLNSICSYLNISTSYFSTIFKELTGETFTEVLIRTRMEKAKELLENTTMKNYEIAEKVGFADPHYFGISFKKMTGCTPTEYAREKRK